LPTLKVYIEIQYNYLGAIHSSPLPMQNTQVSLA